MRRFVDECRKEWNRIGVPGAVSNEMAADLEADLAEAEAEGASPEEVLGNGVFDARSFAVSWAAARGVVPTHQGEIRWPRWTLAVCALVSFVVALAGLVIVGHRVGASSAVAFVRPNMLRIAPFVGPGSVRIAPGLPGRLILFQTSGFRAVGWILLAAGLVGLGHTLWLWRPWSRHRRQPPLDETVGLPSYL